jgi:hypothetical protein
MITKIFEIITKTGKAEKDLENVANAADDAADGIEKVNEGLEKTNKETKKTSGLGKAFGVAKKGAKGLAGGFKLIGTAIKAAGIALVVGLFIALKTALEQNQKVIDGLAIVMETISVVMAEVSRVLTDVYESVSKATENFDALGKVMGGILTLVITPFKIGFEGISAAIIGAQLAWEKSYFGDKDPKKIKELQAELKVIQDNVIKIGLEAVDAGKAIVENAGEAFTEVADIGSQVIDGLKEISIEAAIETAKTNVELKKTAELATVANQGLIEKYDLQAEQQRQIRDEERNSIADRKKANDELLVILDKQEKAMLSNAKAVLAAAQVDLNKFKDNVEFQKAVMEAENELAAVRAQVSGFRSEQLANDLALSKEESELINSKIESENNLSIERKRFNAEQIKDEKERLLELQKIDAEEQKIETARLQGIIDAANVGTQAKIDAEIAFNEFKEASRQQNLLRDKEIAAQTISIEEQTKKTRQQNLDAFEQAATMTMNALIAINELTQAFAKEDEESQKKAFKINKAISIANATINTAVGISKAIASSAPPMNFINAAIVAATGIAAVKNIEKTTFDSSSFDTSAPSTSGGAGGGTGAGTSPTNAPSFNVVGQSGFNQVAGALGQQPPVQAFVVSGDVTTGQQLQNNTITQATF